jgi:Holliday junction resolvase
VSQYRRGYDFERRVAEHLRQQGAVHVIRAPGSRGPADIYAFYPPDSPLTRGRTRVQVIQCKRNAKRFNAAGRARLLELATLIHAEAFFACQGPGGRGVVLERVEETL